MKKIFEKSIFSKKKLKKNKKITINDLIFKKPGDGIKSNLYYKLIGKKSKFNIKANEKLKFKQFY
jgi:sialic acid synthase SpsE